jgi:signal transduction histidine kinase/DNA-binding response OmpR family regulator
VVRHIGPQNEACAFQFALCLCAIPADTIVVVVWEFIGPACFLAMVGFLSAWVGTRRKLADAQKTRRALEASSQVVEEERCVLELIARGASLKQVLDALTAAIERMVPDSICSVLLVDQERGVLQHGSAPNLPPGFWDLCHGLPIAPNVGCCPSAAFSNETVIAEDISTDFRWAPIKDLALGFGLRSCWSVPIRDSQKHSVIGTFAMYHRHPTKPSALDLRAVQAGAHLAGNALERLRTEQRLREYAERFGVAEKVASFGIWQWDPKDGLFTLSEGAAVICGFVQKACRVTLEELYATVHPDDAGMAAAAREQKFGKAGVYEVEFRRIFPNGLVRWFRNHGCTEFEGGVPKRVVGAVIDITEQKELLLRLESAKAAAEAAVQAKGQFLANMSHEIRTPMNAVMGMTSLLLDFNLPPDAQDYVRTIRTSSDSLLSIINDILDFSKIESGKLDLERVPLALHECLEEATELLATKAGEKGLEMAVDVDSSLAEWVYGDTTRMRQIVANLVSNAVKFTEKGEVVVRATKRIAPDGRNEIHIAVQDTGIGIEADKLDRLFQSFSQVDASTTRKFGGTGLGLAISKRLTELMGGRIWVESNPGVGSVFQFTIPYEPAPVQRIAPLPAKDWTGKRALVVDDNPTSRLILAAYLEKWTFSVVTASSGSEAFDHLRSAAYDLILLDWQMPEMDGIELANVVKAEFGQAAPPMVLMITSGVSARQMFGERSNPFESFATKPIRRQQLHRILLRVLSGTAESTSGVRTFDGTLALRAPLRILLADDNLVNQKVAVRLLERWGYRPDAVSNGVEVLEALRRRDYDLVLLDVQMPEMDGFEAARRICAEWCPEKRPLLTALTAGAMKEDREKCLAAGMGGYLSKPINMQELRAVLENCHERLSVRALSRSLDQAENSVLSHS